MHFWPRKKVLVTGHTGFKGSWLSLLLQLKGAELLGLALSPATSPNLFTLANVADNMTSIIGDIRDLALVQQVFRDFQPEIVIHMAAQPLVRAAYKDPITTYATNVMGTIHVLEAARHTESVKAFVNVTTDKCYENREWHWGYREIDTLGGHDPYSNSKACAELITSAYRASYYNAAAIGLASARAGNVIGGGDWAEDRLIPDIMRALQTKQQVSIRNPDAVRPWQHVLEPLTGYLLLAEKLYTSPEAYNGAWNFGPSLQDVQTVKSIVDAIVTHWQGTAICESSPLHEAQYLKLDCSKAQTLLGWQPRWNLARGLEETVAWYQAFFAQEAMQDKTIAQIQQFLGSTGIFGVGAPF